MKKINKGAIIFTIIVAAILILGGINLYLSIFDPFAERVEQQEGSEIKESAWGYIACLNIEGVIQDHNETYDQKWLLSTIKTLKNDSDNKALALYIDSPGGNVYQSDELYLALKDYKKKGKPVYAYMGPLAASGGYYISCAADKIFANRNTLTGSIGVISGMSVDTTELLEKIGIKTKTITSGRNKNMMNFNEPFSEEQQKIMQDISDECYEQFTKIVSREREIEIEKVKEIADGRIYTAKQAKNLNLIDQIANNFNDMLVSMEREELDNTSYKIKRLEYAPELSLAEQLLFGKSELSKKASTFLSKLNCMNLTFPAYLYH